MLIKPTHRPRKATQEAVKLFLPPLHSALIRNYTYLPYTDHLLSYASLSRSKRSHYTSTWSIPSFFHLQRNLTLSSWISQTTHARTRGISRFRQTAAYRCSFFVRCVWSSSSSSTAADNGSVLYIYIYKARTITRSSAFCSSCRIKSNFSPFYERFIINRRVKAQQAAG